MSARAALLAGLLAALPRVASAQPAPADGAALLALAESLERAAFEAPAEPDAPVDLRCAAQAWRRAARSPEPRVASLALHRLAAALRALRHPDEAALAQRASLCPSLGAYEPLAELSAADETFAAPARCPEALRGTPEGRPPEVARREAAARYASALRVVRYREGEEPPPVPGDFARCAWPEGREETTRAAEGWFELGEDLHLRRVRAFDGSHDFATLNGYALAAYRRAVEGLERAASPAQATEPLYGRALLRLATSWFRQDRGYPEAMAQLARLADYGVARGPSDPWRYDRVAIQWMAMILLEGAWGTEPQAPVECQPLVARVLGPVGDSVPYDCSALYRLLLPAVPARALLDADAPSAGFATYVPRERVWSAEVFLAVARGYAERTMHLEAAATFALFLQRHPTHREALAAARELLGSLESARAFLPAARWRLRLASYVEQSAAENALPEPTAQAYARFARDARLDAAVSLAQQASLARVARASSPPPAPRRAPRAPAAPPREAAAADALAAEARLAREEFLQRYPQDRATSELRELAHP